MAFSWIGFKVWIQLAHIGRARSAIHADQLLEIEWFAFGLELFGFRSHEESEQRPALWQSEAA